MKRINNILIPFGTVVIISFFCRFSYSEETTISLRLSAKSDKETYKLGEPIKIELSLKNLGNTPLNVFHPDSIHKGWHNWKLKCYVTKPNGQKRELIPEVTSTSMVLIPDKKHYKTLVPDQMINIPIKLEVEQSDTTYTKSGWIALIEISKMESDDLPTKLLREKYNIQGEFYIYYIIDGNNYIALKDVITDVFNTTGQYMLEFQYENLSNIFLEPNEQNNGFVMVDAPHAWTGLVSEKIKIQIIK